MAARMSGQYSPYDMNGGSWSHEPQHTYDGVAASPYFGRNGETLHMDTQPAFGFPSFGGQDGMYPLQTSPLEIQRTHESAIVSPVSLKRHGTDSLQVGDAALSRNGSKRSKNERLERREDQLYECTWPGCSHRAGLMCEIRKHFTATHKPEEARPHGCPYCEKRFNWPKDVRRHLGQKHKNLPAVEVVHPTAEPPALIKGESMESDDFPHTPTAPNAQPELTPSATMNVVAMGPPGHIPSGGKTPNFVTPPSKVPTQPTADGQPKPPKKKKKFSFASVGSLIMALQSLSLGRGSKDTDYESDGQRHILVTQDRKSWQKVSLDNVKTSESLLQRIVDVYQQPDGRQTSSFRLYRHHPGKHDKRIPETHLLAAARKAAAARHTLEIVLSPKSPAAK